MDNRMQPIGANKNNDDQAIFSNAGPILIIQMRP